MALRIGTTCLVLFAIQFSLSTALISSPDFNPPYPKALSDLKEAIVKGLGFQTEDFKISGFDLRDALVGRSVAYEFNVEIDNNVLPLKLMEDVNRWEYVDLPIFRVEEDSKKPGNENGLVERKGPDDNGLPVLAPFQLAGPMELWIQDAKDMRLSLPVALPWIIKSLFGFKKGTCFERERNLWALKDRDRKEEHDVDAGVLKKVILADGAVVTVKGARSVSLRHPIELPLPLNRTQNGFASGLLTLADRLRHGSRTQGNPLLSLRIVGPTSLGSPTSSSSSPINKLKLKRLAPGLVELSSASKMKAIETISNVNLQGEVHTPLTPDSLATLWPLTSVNGTNSNLLGFETLLSSVLGSKANEEGSFKLLKADVSAQTFVKIGFGVEKKLTDGDGVDLKGFPEWRTKPETVKMHFEVLAKIDGNKVVPERIMQVNPVVVEDSVAPNVLMGNMTMSRTPIVHAPPNPFSL